MKILVVDDDRGARLLQRALLTKLGHEVTEAPDGTDAWRLLKEERFPLIISDWEMDQMDGPELCRRVRELPGSYTYFMMVTGRDDLESFTEGMAAGADDFLTKPVNVGVLSARVRVAERILALQKTVGDLTEILPVCIYCRKIVATEETWQMIRLFLDDNPNLQLAERICPDCYKEQIAPDLDKIDG